MAGMFKQLRAVVAVALLAVAAYAAAVEMRGDHPDTYVVRKGDTLWDIAGRFLNKPWLWPEIWQANPQVKNPHLIYPGDVLSLAYLNRVASVAVEAGPRLAPPVNAVPLSEVEPFLRDLTVVDEFDELPYVVGLEDNRLRGTSGQLVYVRGLTLPVGTKVSVVRPTTAYYRLDRTVCCDIIDAQDLDSRGEPNAVRSTFWRNVALSNHGHQFLGDELAAVGSATVTRVPYGGVEVSTLLVDGGGEEIRVGDRVVPVNAQPYDLQFFPHPPKADAEYAKWQVMAVAGQLDTGGPHEVIALSAGSADGIDNGTVVSLWRRGDDVVDRVRYDFPARSDGSTPSGQRLRLPDEFAGHAMVFRTFDKVSYALVMDATKPVQVGNVAKQPDSTQ
jgi:hypothetical protein